MGWFTDMIIFDAACALLAVSAVVIGPEIAAAAGLKGMLLAGTAIVTVEDIAITTTVAAATMTAMANTVASVVSHTRERDYDPFDSPPPKKPRPDPLKGGNQTDQGNQTDGRVPEKDGDTQTEVEYENPRIPLAKPIQPGDYAGIQKTMYDPVTGNILGLKLHARTHRGSIHSNLRHVSNMLRRSGARVHSVKATSYSPVRPHGHVWDSAFRP